MSSTIIHQEAWKQLESWRKKKTRKPLIIRGARQVGKTWLVKQFGQKQYPQLAYFNCEGNQRLINLFALDFNPERIIAGLELEIGFKINPLQTLLVFDEIQEIPPRLIRAQIFSRKCPSVPNHRRW